MFDLLWKDIASFKIEKTVTKDQGPQDSPHETFTSEFKHADV